MRYDCNYEWVVWSERNWVFGNIGSDPNKEYLFEFG